MKSSISAIAEAPNAVKPFKPFVLNIQIDKKIEMEKLFKLTEYDISVPHACGDHTGIIRDFLGEIRVTLHAQIEEQRNSVDVQA